MSEEISKRLSERVYREALYWGAFDADSSRVCGKPVADAVLGEQPPRLRGIGLDLLLQVADVRTLAESGVREHFGLTVEGNKRPGEDFQLATPGSRVQEGDLPIVSGPTVRVEKFAGRGRH